MINIEFYYKDQITKIPAELPDIFQKVIDIYVQKASLDPVNTFFISNGKQIKPEQTIESQINKNNKEEKNLKVMVYHIKERNSKEKILIQSKDIICPICNELSRIKFDNFKITLYCCNNNKHSTKNIKIKDFPNTQKINLCKIFCNQCKINNMGNSSNNEFYKCLTCNSNLCLNCKKNHSSNHVLVNYEIKDYLCQKHYDFISNYCLTCNMNICSLCKKQHKEHNIISLNDIDRNIFETKNSLLEIKSEIKTFNSKIKEIIQKLDKLINMMKIFEEINDNIFNSFCKRNPYYQIYQNLKEINLNTELFKSIKYINSTTNPKDKLYNILELYNQLNPDKKTEIKEKTNEINNCENNNINKINNITDKINQMSIIYEIHKNMDKIRLFGNSFVKNNKNNCYLLIDGKQNELVAQLNLNDNQKSKNTLEIKLIEIKNKSINNIDYMFFNCTFLKSLPDISNWFLKNTTSIYAMFYNCISLLSLPELTQLDKEKIFDMNYHLYGCNSLECLLYISKWETKDMTNIDSSYFDSFLLDKLEDLSECDGKVLYETDEGIDNSDSDSELDDDLDYHKKFKHWKKRKKKKDDNTVDMSYMFHGCASLKNVPDFSRWNIKKKVTNVTGMFAGCTSLKSFPDLSRLNINHGIKKKSLFVEENEKIIAKKIKNC